MKNLILILFCFTLSFSSLSAQEDKINYFNGSVYMVFLSAETGEEITEIPEGKDCMVMYDKFFKSYTLLYKNSAGTSQMTSYNFVQDLPDGWIKVKDSQSGEDYKIMDLLEEEGGLVIHVLEDDEKIGLVLIEGLTKR